jgi:hypothetical protein
MAMRIRTPAREWRPHSELVRGAGQTTLASFFGGAHLWRPKSKLGVQAAAFPCWRRVFRSSASHSSLKNRSNER